MPYDVSPYYECYCPEGYYDSDAGACYFDASLDCYYDEYWGEYVCYEEGYCEADWNLYYSSDDTHDCLDDCEYGIDYDSCVFQESTVDMGDGYYYYADYCACNAEEVEEDWDMYTETPYRCEDPFWCALTPPGSDPFVWESLEDELSEWRVGYFENDGEAYAPCVETWEMLEQYNTYKLYDAMYESAYY